MMKTKESNTFKLIELGLKVWVVVVGGLALGSVVAVIYVAVHFLAKVW